MARCCCWFVCLVVGIIGCIQGSAQEYSALKQMTLQESDSMGFDKLSDSQKNALNTFVLRMMSVAYQTGLGTCSKVAAKGVKPAPSQPSAIPRTNGSYVSGGGHWLKSKADDGQLLTLEDGSIWEVMSSDRIDSALWLPISNITVLDANPSYGDFKYILINTDDSEKVYAKYVGHR